MADISLTASMRSNLLSLQQTQSLMDTTQERLSTGKKVNSAIDNPSSYYTAQSLNNRASDLSSLLDSMGQGIQTIKAADEAIKAITTFTQQAKAIANSARDSATNKSVTSGGTLAASTTDTLSFSYDGKTYTTGNIAITVAVAGAPTDAEKTTAATAIAAAMNSAVNGADTSGITFTASVVDGQIKISNGGEAAKFIDGTAAGLTFSGEVGNTDRANSMTQYNDILTQIDQLAKDAGYKGVNLLQENDLKVTFNEDRSSFLNIKGVDADAGGLGLSAATGWESNAAIDATVTAVDSAIAKLRNMASEFGNNYSVVQNREDFTENLVNVLTEGADKLTLADMNEESANMLALQTRQQLAINSLSLASQAAQSVLKLF